MNTYKRHTFPPDIISYPVWLYYRFNLSHRRCAAPFRSMASSIIFVEQSIGLSNCMKSPLSITVISG
jgi:hypothetical protein